MIEKITIGESEVSVEILPSAMKHGHSRDDIISALKRSVYDETLKNKPDETLSIGYDTNKKLLELIFHVISDEHIVVFHSTELK